MINSLKAAKFSHRLPKENKRCATYHPVEFPSETRILFFFVLKKWTKRKKKVKVE